jgi:iron complex outermembrane recepter protein
MYIGRRLPLSLLVAAVAFVALLRADASAQAPPLPVRGVVTDSAGNALANARVTLAPTSRAATTDASGSFLFRSVPAGRYHLDVSLIGYAPGHAQIAVPEEGDDLFVEIQLAASPLALEGVLVTGTPGASDPLTVAQSATQLSGRAFDRHVGATVAETLDREPGITSRYSGPAAATPVIRGLTGERVVMLENGQRTGDLSGSAADHALSVDPLSATRLEVVRGPASLLYGSGALGGVVNVIGTDIASNVPSRVEGYFATQGASVTPGGAATAQLILPLSDVLVLSTRGGVRRMGDVRTGGGEVLENTTLSTLNGNLGLGYVGGRVTGGVALNAHSFAYGVPFGHSHEGEEGEEEEEEHEDHMGVDLEGHRYELTLRGGWDPAGSMVRAVRAAASGQWYEHDEIESDGSVGTTFTLRTQTLDLRADNDFGLVRGTLGVSGLLKQYEPTGEEALTPFARSGNLGVFVYQEAPLVPGGHESEHVPHLQVGARFDHYDISTQAGEARFGPARERTFRAFSGSVGVNLPLPQGVSVGASVARAFRAPSVEELFSNALHAATASFDVGNPELRPEVNLGLEGMLRAHTRSVTALVSAYYNHIDDYIAPEIVGDTLLVDDAGSFRVPLNRFSQQDASLIGVEGKVELLVGRSVVVGARGDRVRGRFADDTPLPFMPSARLGGDLRWDDGTYSLGAETVHAFAQGEVPEHELATESYTLLDLSVGYTRTTGGLVHNLMLRAENVTDAVYREATSRIKELAPNPGRNLSLVYRLLF